MSATVHAFAEMRYEETDDPTHFLVHSPSGNTYHVTNVGKEGVKPACSCQDHLMRGHACKHILFILSSAFTEKEQPMTDQQPELSSEVQFWRAFIKAQSSLKAAEKGAVNPAFGKRKYADLGDVWEACKEALQENGFGVMQCVGLFADGCQHVTTILAHAGGFTKEYESSIPVPKPDPQGSGIGITYLRRYTLAAMMGVLQEDDDGNGARWENNRPPQQQRSEAPSGRVQQPSAAGPTNADVWSQFTSEMAAVSLTSSNLRPILEPFGGFNAAGVKAALAAGETFESLFAMAKDNA